MPTKSMILIYFFRQVNRESLAKFQVWLDLNLFISTGETVKTGKAVARKVNDGITRV